MEEKRINAEKKLDLIVRAWFDEELYKKLVSDPVATYEVEMGVKLPHGVKVVVHVEKPNEIHLVLPPKPSTKRIKELKGHLNEASRKIAKEAFIKASRLCVPCQEYAEGEMEG